MAREYTNKITLAENGRGIFSLDTVMGCASGTADNSKGCYGDCYAARYSKKYGYDFSRVVLRSFDDEKHIKSIVKKINNISMPFFRVGTSGDPSEDWEHTIKTLERLVGIEKEIVIITKHWNELSGGQLGRLRNLNLCINSSVSALDDEEVLERGLAQYEILKQFCKSVLRVVTCEFNTESEEGLKRHLTQERIINNYQYIDTIFRVSKSNDLVKSGVIKTNDVKFLGKKCTISKLNKKAFFGKCKKCPEMCGVNYEATS